jgi:hypothetical protein
LDAILWKEEKLLTKRIEGRRKKTKKSVPTLLFGEVVEEDSELSILIRDDTLLNKKHDFFS